MGNDVDDDLSIFSFEGVGRMIDITGINITPNDVVTFTTPLMSFAFPDDFWERAKQPVRTIGLGLHDLTAVAHINYVAAHGAVARLCKTITAEMLEEAPPLSLPKVTQQLQHDAELIGPRDLEGSASESHA